MDSQVVVEGQPEGNEQVKKWLQNNGHTLLYGIAAAAAVLLFLFKYTSSNRVQSETDFMTADLLINEYRMGESETTLTQLNEQITRHPELAGKYQGLISQVLLAREGEGGVQMASESLSDWGKALPKEWKTFSLASLSVEKGEWESARKSDSELRLTSIQEETPFLYDYLRLRELALAKKNGSVNIAALFEQEFSPEFLAHLGIDQQLLKRFAESE